MNDNNFGQVSVSPVQRFKSNAKGGGFSCPNFFVYQKGKIMFNVKCSRAPMAVLIGFLLTACGGGGGGGGGAAPAPLTSVALPETGQTTCTDTAGTAIACAGTGQDGELQTGVADPSPRFTVLNCAGLIATAVVTDNLTGLMWAADPSATAATWANALTTANDLTLCGFTDWRLPNRKELRSLINYSSADNAATLNGLGFGNVQADVYWSSSSYAGNAARAWIVGMSVGSVNADVKTSSNFVWPVRAGQ